jgi:hypothetical protein
VTRATGREDQPGADHPAYAVDQEDPGDREDRIYEAWKDQDINGD